METDQCPEPNVSCDNRAPNDLKLRGGKSLNLKDTPHLPRISAHAQARVAERSALSAAGQRVSGAAAAAPK